MITRVDMGFPLARKPCGLCVYKQNLGCAYLRSRQKVRHETRQTKHAVRIRRGSSPDIHASDVLAPRESCTCRHAKRVYQDGVVGRAAYTIVPIPALDLNAIRRAGAMPIECQPFPHANSMPMSLNMPTRSSSQVARSTP